MRLQPKIGLNFSSVAASVSMCVRGASETKETKKNYAFDGENPNVYNETNCDRLPLDRFQYARSLMPHATAQRCQHKIGDTNLH